MIVGVDHFHSVSCGYVAVLGFHYSFITVTVFQYVTSHSYHYLWIFITIVTKAVQFIQMQTTQILTRNTAKTLLDRIQLGKIDIYHNLSKQASQVWEDYYIQSFLMNMHVLSNEYLWIFILCRCRVFQVSVCWVKVHSLSDWFKKAVNNHL